MLSVIRVAFVVAMTTCASDVPLASNYNFNHEELKSIVPTTSDTTYKVTVTYLSLNNTRKASIAGYVIPHFNKDIKQPAWPLLPLTNQTSPATGTNENSVELQSPVDATANGTLIFIRMHYKEGDNWYVIEKAQLVGAALVKESSPIAPTVSLSVPAAPINAATPVSGNLGMQPISDVTIEVTLDCGGTVVEKLAVSIELGNTFSFTLPSKPAGSECMVCVMVKKTATGEYTRSCFWVKYSASLERLSISGGYLILSTERLWAYSLNDGDYVATPTKVGESDCRITNIGPAHLAIYNTENKYIGTIGPNTIDYKPGVGVGFIKAVASPTGNRTTGIFGVTRSGHW